MFFRKKKRRNAPIQQCLKTDRGPPPQPGKDESFSVATGIIAVERDLSESQLDSLARPEESIGM